MAAYRFGHCDGRARPNKKIDTMLSTPLFHLLGQPPATPTSLASRNLLRALTMGLPSGQRVARTMTLPELAPADLADLKDLQLHLRTPLWFYVLREAAVTASGEHLGPVGGRIVTEVVIGLLEGDRQSDLRQAPIGHPRTAPTAPSQWWCGSTGQYDAPGKHRVRPWRGRPRSGRVSSTEVCGVVDCPCAEGPRW